MKAATSLDGVECVSKISHELKNPVHGIMGLSNYLFTNWETIDDNSKKIFIKDIAEAANILFAIQNNLFDSYLVDSKASYSFARTDIINLINNVVRSANVFFVFKDQTNILVNYQPESLYLELDRFWFSQVLTNLIQNAIKHGKASIIEINVKLVLHNEKLEALVTIADNGIGIANEELDSIFIQHNRGENLNNNSDGFGLGLAICREIITAHGGSIWAERGSLGGAEICISLPLSDDNRSLC